MKLRQKFVLLTSVLLLLAVGGVSVYVDRQVRRDFAATLTHFEREAMASRRAHLQSVVSMAHGIAGHYLRRVHTGELTDTEGRRRFLAHLSSLRYDRGIGYFWIHDFRPQPGDSVARVAMHGTFPPAIGTPIAAWTDLDRLDLIMHDGRLWPATSPALAEHGIRPTAFLLAANELCATSGEGFLEYFWRKPAVDSGTTREGYRKLSLVKLIPEWDWVIGSGIYLDDIENEVALRRVELESRFREVLTLGVLVVVLILACSILATFYFSARLTGPLSLLAESAEDLARGGQPEIRPSRNAGDEVGALERSFASMSEAIRRREGELKERAADLERLNDDLKVLSRTKGMILANVSHELKTPLAAIRGYCELLRSGSFGPLHDIQREKLSHCIRNADALVSLINEILSFAEAGSRVPGAPSDVDLRAVMGDAAEACRARAAERGVKVTLRLPEVPVVVRGEPERLTQVFRHLLDNAIKFSPAEGKVSIGLVTLDAGRSAEVRVQDEGLGIPAEEMARVFSDFYQVDPTPSRKHGGLGLGLAIARVIVEQNGGSIRLEGGEGRGVEVIVRFPLPGEPQGAA